MSTQPSGYSTWPAENERFQLALRVVAGDLPPTNDRPFGHPDARVPGWIDKRVILQSDVWIDRRGEMHLLDHDMTPDYRANVLALLQQEASAWMADARTAEIVAAILGVTAPQDSSDHLELLELLTPGWTDHTPLALRLHGLNYTRPHPLAAPRTPVNAERSDKPEVLRDHDSGQWLVNTQSGTTYLVDLDRRRIQRRPHGATPGENGDRSTTSANRLPLDHAWTDLDYLVQCRTGTGLVALDHRPGTDARSGYRISTNVIAIQRGAGPRPATASSGS